MTAFLQSWIPFGLIAMAGFVAYNVCAKLGGGNLPPVIFASVMYTAGFICIIPIFFWYMHGKEILPYMQSLPLMPVLFAIGAGIVVIFIDTSISAMFNRDAPIGMGMSSLSVGSIALTTLIGFLFFKENISVINIIGVVLAVIAVPLMFYSQK